VTVTLVLRFRDLSGPTIDEHRRLIGDHGEVWWGWWSKPGEQVPRQLFADVLDEIRKNGSVTWFLADSGHERLYRATITEIRYSASSDRLPSPDPTRTPPYYAGSEYLAWFLMSDIADAAPEELHAMSYEEPPADSFDEDPHREAFHGKRVFSLKELLSRHRTLYFLRPVLESDPSHYVSLAARERVAPFMSGTHELPSSYIVHLSDLHFGPEHAYPRQSDAIHRNLALRVSDDLEAEYPGVPPAAVILSGDFTWKGEPDEYLWAGEFIDHLQSVFKLQPSRFVVCPGNHDIRWSTASPYDPAAPVTVAPPQAQANYRAFAKDTLQLGLPDSSLAMGRRFLLSNFLPVDIVALNSSRLEQQHFAGYGFVSRAQLDEAVAAMNWRSDNKGAQLRIIVLHHHVVPVTPVETIAVFDVRYSLTLDASELLYRALELDVDLILHGHMHQPFGAFHGRVGPGTTFPATRRLAIQAAGSAGVKPAHLPPGAGGNGYLIYEFRPDRVRVRRRASASHVTGFSDDGEHTLTRTQAGLA
jgi:3',5'-cyclic AMP phosphodiesterase CpdA